MTHSRIILLLAPLFLLFLSGCQPSQPTKQLSDAQRQDAYRKVRKEINFYKERAEEYERKGYYNDTLFAYQKINYLEGRELYSKSKIAQLEQQALKNGKLYYAKALKVLKKSKIQSLYYLNRMMHNTPPKGGEALFNKVKQRNDVKKFIAKRKKALQKALDRYNGTISSMSKLHAALKSLTDYEDPTPLATKAKVRMRLEFEALLNSALTLYNQKKYATAKQHFELLQALYDDDITIKEHLSLIDEEEKITLAEAQLHNKEYTKASLTAQTVLKKNPQNERAKAVISSAAKAKNNQIPQLLKTALDNYRHQEFNKAKNLFEKILSIDPDHKVAAIYLKKIEHQLQTIQSLR